jgi:multiple sugar transport system permease protein
VLEPVRDDADALVRDETGALTYPSLRGYTRNEDEYPQYYQMKELAGWQWGDRHVSLLVRDLVFVRALINTFAFVIVVAPVQGGLALLLALLINQKLKGINIFRTIYFMPVVVSIVVVALLWRFIYAGQNGLLNALLGFLTFGAFKPIDWLGLPQTALWSILAMSVWQGVGFHMVIWLSGLQTISVSLYEAAELDGANRWQQFVYVTWPGLRNTAVLVLIVITMQAFALFPQIDVMTKGGPLDSTQSIVFQAVQRGYVQQDIASGSAISVILFVFVLTISMVQRWLTRERNA